MAYDGLFVVVVHGYMAGILMKVWWCFSDVSVGRRLHRGSLWDAFNHFRVFLFSMVCDCEVWGWLVKMAEEVGEQWSGYMKKKNKFFFLLFTFFFTFHYPPFFYIFLQINERDPILWYAPPMLICVKIPLANVDLNSVNLGLYFQTIPKLLSRYFGGSNWVLKLNGTKIKSLQ